MKVSTLMTSTVVSLASVCAATTRLTNRTNTGVEFVSGNYVAEEPGFLGGTWLLFYNTNNITLSGTGYLRLRWEVEYWKKAGEAADLLTEYTGTWLQVAGGGGWQFGDSPAPYCNDASGVCINGTGGEDSGYTWFSDLSNPWHDQYYWLDGQVYLQTQEGPGLYNVGVQAMDLEDILDDINTNTSAIYHYGVSFDPVEGSCPCVAA